MTSCGGKQLSLWKLCIWTNMTPWGSYLWVVQGVLSPLLTIFQKQMWVYMLKMKCECLEKSKEFKALVKMQLEHKIKVLRSDNNDIFIPKEFTWYYEANIQLIYASTKRNGRVCILQCCRDGEKHASCLETQQVILGESGSECNLHM